MTGTTALRWPTGDAAATGCAERLRRRLLHLGWWFAIDEPGWCVALDQPDAPWVLCPCAEGPAVLVGQLFDRAATVHGREPEDIVPSGSPRFEMLARTLVARGWGGYVALGIDASDPEQMAILRDPIGALECVTWCVDGVRIVSSAPEPLLSVARPAGLAIDWTRLAAILAFPGSVGEQLPWIGLDAIPPGTLVEARGETLRETRIWHPASFCIPLPASTQAPEHRLAALVDRCLATWISDVRNGVAELSGGLDSAIVAAAAVRAKPPAIRHWFHYSSDDLAGDERCFARAVADHLDLPLTSIVRTTRSLGIDDIDTMPVAVRPGLGGASLFHDRDLAARLDARGADAVLTGHGGDAIFFQPASLLVAADLCSDGRSLADSWTALMGIASWTHVPIWRTLWIMLRAGLGLRTLPVPPTMHRFLGAAAGDARHHSPWLEGIGHLAPAKQLQIWMLANSRSAFGASWCGQGRRMIPPLLSQPLIEHVLAIPAIQLTSGHRDRALARAAFAHRLPSALIERCGKGDLTLYFGRMLASSTDFLRDTLLDGVLAAHHVIDRSTLETILTPEHLIAEDHYSELLTSLMLERWARVWIERLSARDHQGEDGAAEQALPETSK